MALIDQLASSLGINSENPNIEMAVRIAERGQASDVQELIELLRHKNSAVASDVIKVLYELGARKPDMIASHVGVFIELLTHKNNRLIWGAMTALDEIASVNPVGIAANLGQIMAAADRGSIITIDHAVGILIKLAAHDQYHHDAMALLLDRIKTCAQNQLPKYCEDMLPVISSGYKDEFSGIIETRLPEMDKASKQARLLKVHKKLSKL